MRRAIQQKIWDVLRDAAARRRKPRSRAQLQVYELEGRVLPSASTFGTLSGVVFVDGNGNGVRDAQEAALPGVTVTLAGTTSQDNTVQLTATSDAQGSYAFRSVQAGIYQLSAAAGSSFIDGSPTVSGISILAGQNTTQDLSVDGLAPGAISLRQFLSSTTTSDFPFQPGGATANHSPFVNTPIANITLASNASQTVNMAAHFSDADITTSQVRFDTSDGAMIVNLDDAQAPQTVANFYDYVLNNRYDNTIFHRLDTNPAVLQAGGFTLQADASQGFTFPQVAAPNEPTVQNEFSASLPDVQGTLAMAKLGSDPNSATSQFFFNLADNSSTLGASNNGGFAVFGNVASDATSQNVFKQLQGTPVKDESATNSAFNVLPLNNYSGTKFPTDTQQSNYLLINDVVVVKRDESLTYSVVSNSNPAVVSAQFDANHSELLNVQAVGQGGTTTITVRATDQLGASVDTTFDVTVVPLTITSVTDPITPLNDTKTVISGTATAGAAVSVLATDGSTSTSEVSTTAGSDGAWTANIDASGLADGTITYTATTTDAAGHTATASKTATKDTVAPSVTVSSVTSPINAANQKTTVVVGTAEANASISVVATDGTKTTPAAKTTAGTDGKWVVNLDVSSLADGVITFTATATDAAGNSATATQGSTKDTVAPAVAMTTVTDPINLANQSSTVVSGTAEAGANISLVASDGTTTTSPVTTTAGSDGTWTVNNIDVSSLADGTITYTATATDAAGNSATATKTAAKSTVTITSATNPVKLSDEKTTSASGTVEAGATVTVMANDGAGGHTTTAVTAVVTGTTWTASNIDVSGLNDGTITYVVTATDGANNTGTARLTTVKSTVGITSVTDPINGKNASNTTVSGTSEAGAAISVVASKGISSTPAVTTTAAADGTWTVILDVTSLPDGTITYTATATAGGNTATAQETASKNTAG